MPRAKAEVARSRDESRDEITRRLPHDDDVIAGKQR
jgi:hypothetical protein